MHNCGQLWPLSLFLRLALIESAVLPAVRVCSDGACRCYSSFGRRCNTALLTVSAHCLSSSDTGNEVADGTPHNSTIKCSGYIESHVWSGVKTTSQHHPPYNLHVGDCIATHRSSSRCRQLTSPLLRYSFLSTLQRHSCILISPSPIHHLRVFVSLRLFTQ